MITRVMVKTGEMLQGCGMIYKAVAQSEILYGNKIWVVTGEMLKVLEGFHHRSERRITGIMATHGAGREWE